MASQDVEKKTSPDTEKTLPPNTTRPGTFDNDDTRSALSDRTADVDVDAQPGDVDLDILRIDSAFEPPDGGLLAWTQVLAGNLVNCISWGYPATFGVYQLYYKETAWPDLPQAQISWIGSVQLFLTFVACTFSGRLADAGYVKTTLAAGSFMVVFGTFMTSIATEYWQVFLAQGVCTGLGLGIMFMPPLTVINSYFRRKRALALAIAATGTGFGAVIFPATIQYLIPRVGFGWAVRVSAFVALVICVTATCVLKPRLTPRRTGPWVEWSAFTEGPYVLFTLGAFLTFWALYFGFFYINVYARNVVGFDTVSSVQLLLIMNGMSVPSRPVTGFLADYVLGPVNTFTIMTMVLAGMVFAWIGVHTRTDMYVFAVFFGLANGAAQGVYVGALASLTKDPRKMGTRFGMVCTVVAFATLAGPPTAGAIIDKDGGRYIWAQVWAGIVIALGSFTIGLARIRSTGWRLKVKI